MRRCKCVVGCECVVGVDVWMFGALGVGLSIRVCVRVCCVFSYFSMFVLGVSVCRSVLQCVAVCCSVRVLCVSM